MIAARLARMLRALGALAFRAAAKLDPPPPLAPALLFPPEPFEDQEMAAVRLCREIEARQLLRAAIRRFAPAEPPGEA